MNDFKLKMQGWLAKLDAMSLRERLFLFLSAIVCLVAVADMLWLGPVQEANKKLAKQFASQSTELGQLRDEFKALGQPVDPSKAVRDDIAVANTRLDALNEDINALLPRAKNGPDLEQVLVQFLRTQKDLTLLGLKTLQNEVSPAAAAAAPGSVALAATGLPAGMTRKGLELRIAGPYADLVRYVQQLETALPALRWGAMGIKSDAQPPELTLQVFVLGVQPV
jgi:MSHA biogenesis protein MshJ